MRYIAMHRGLVAAVVHPQRKYGTALRGAIMVEFSSVSVKYFTSRSRLSSKHKMLATLPHLQAKDM